MLGHKSSLNPIKGFIKEAGAASWTWTEFVQGRTMRWGIAWTYCETIPLSQAAEMSPSKAVKKKVTPPFIYPVEKDRWGEDKGEYSVAGIMQKVLEQLTLLKVFIFIL